MDLTPPPLIERHLCAAAERRWGMSAGMAVSLLLHGLLIFGVRLAMAPPRLPPAAAVGPPLTVWLRPAPPVSPERQAAPSVQARLQSPPKAPARPPRKEKPPPAPADALAARPQPAAAAPSQPAAPITRPSPAGEARADYRASGQPPTFDMDAALRTARAMADEPDPERAGKPVAQLDRKPLYPKSTESKLSRGINEAKRSDCKDGIPGGLLAPLYLMMDKKDSGCKW